MWHFLLFPARMLQFGHGTSLVSPSLIQGALTLLPGGGLDSVKNQVAVCLSVGLSRLRCRGENSPGTMLTVQSNPLFNSWDHVVLSSVQIRWWSSVVCSLDQCFAR